MKSRTNTITLFATVLAMLVSAVGCRAQGDIPALVETLKGFRYGDSPAPLDKLTAQIADARLDADRRSEAARALATVLPSGASFEAKQFACRQLVFVAGDEQIPAVTALLSDTALAHYALLVLARIHSSASADALLQALPSSSGRIEIEVLDTLADIGDARVVPKAVERLRATDPALHDSAASVLAKLADGAAVQALRAAYSQETGPAHATMGHALLAAASRLQRRGDTKSALELFGLLEQNPASPFLGAAALRGVAGIRGEQALPLVLQAMSEEGSRRQQAAATLLREMSGRTVAARLAGVVITMRGQAQLLALDILADRGDPVAASAVTTLCRSADPRVRAAALHAAGSIGDASTVPLLLGIGAMGAADERAAARDSLVRMRGATVDRALLKALDTATPAEQVLAIQALGLRGAMGVAPRLLRAAHSSALGVSAAALRVLRDQGSPTLLPGLLDLLLETPPDTRDAAIDAVTQIARRSPNPSQGITLLLERLAGAGKPADRVALVSVAGQLGGPDALRALRKAVTDASAEVRLAALSALAEWNTEAPIMDLLRTARTSSDAKLRPIALRGYLRMAASGDQRTPAQALALFKDVQPLATRPEEKRLALAGLAKIPSPEALDFAVTLLGDKDVRAEAELAIVEIGKATLGAWPEKTRAALESIVKSGGNADARARAEIALAVSRKFGDFVVAWEVSPSYQKDGADYTHLFDVAFAPEQAVADRVPWRPLPVGAAPDQPWLLDLLALWGGEQRVAYLRTAVWCDSARDLTLEMGSDDGLKVWWNRQVLLAHNTARAVVPGQEKVTAHAKAGWNLLLLKITQNNQGWGAAVRITNPDGTPAPGIKYALPSVLKPADLMTP